MPHATNAIVADFEALRRRTLRRQRLQSGVGLLVVSLILVVSFQRSQVFSSDIGGDPLGRVADFLTRMTPVLHWDSLFAGRNTTGSLAAWFYDLPAWLRAIRETIEMAIIATVIGFLGAVGASFLCARNLMPWSPVRFFVRRGLEVIRTMPDLVLALILVAAFGVGALPGVVTLAISTMGGLGKLFAEINEEVDPRQLEALDAAGAGTLNKIRFGVLPQVLPAYASYCLLRLEGNLAAASALGIVGAGGIGLELQRAITYTEFSTYLAILLLMITMIFVIDLVSEAIRHRLIRLEPEALFAGLSKLGRFLSAMVPPSDGGDSLRILRSLAETFAMAVAGTVLAVVAAVPLGLLGAKTIVRSGVAHFLFRRCLDIFRGVPALVWALIFISAFGLGPFAGVIALAFADIPNLAKLFAESLENCDPGPSEGARAAGVSKLMEIRFGLAPQVAPVMASQCLYFLESNFRHAAVLGIVGAGGIGFELDERIRVFAFDQVAFIVLLYMLGVAVLDFGSRSLRARLA